MQISAGLNSIFGIEPSKFVWLIVEIIIVAGFLLMSIGGIAKGIKIITDRNLELYILVLIFVIGFGPTLYVFDMFTESTSTTFGRLCRAFAIREASMVTTDLFSGWYGSM